MCAAPGHFQTGLSITTSLQWPGLITPLWRALFATQWVCIYTDTDVVCVFVCDCSLWMTLHPLVASAITQTGAKLTGMRMCSRSKYCLGVHTLTHTHWQAHSAWIQSCSITPLDCCQWFTYSVFHVQLIGSWTSLRPCMVFTKVCWVGQLDSCGLFRMKHVNAHIYKHANTLTLSWCSRTALK